MKELRWQICFLVLAGGIVSLLNYGIPTLDARFSYTVEEARYFLSSLSDKALHRHFWGECADLFLFIPAYTWLLMGLAVNSKNQMLRNFSALMATADILETSTILYCLKSGNLAPHYLPGCTTLKWLSLGGFVVLYLNEKKLLLRSLWRR